MCRKYSRSMKSSYSWVVVIVTLGDFFLLFYFSVFSKFPIMDIYGFLKIKKLFVTRLFLENSRSTNRYTIYNDFMKKIQMNISCFSF